MPLSWDEAVTHALALPGARLSDYYGKPAVKAGNGRAFLATGHEPDSSFALAVGEDAAELLLTTDPASFWQTPHYVGSGTVLVRFATPDPERVRAAIDSSHARVAGQAAPRPRSPKTQRRSSRGHSAS